MFDLAITESGDLMFLEEDKKEKDFKVTFNISAGKTLKLSFKVDNSSTIQKRTNEDLVVSFKIRNKVNNKKALTVSNNNALIQAIRIRLLTSIGEIKIRPEFGSKLELVKHRPLYDKKVQITAAEYIKDAISDILPSATIKVKPVINHNMNYSQCLCAYIYKGDKMIYKHVF